MDDLASIDQEQLNRRLKFADMLRQQAMQQDQQQTAGGWVTPYSPLQGAAKLLQGYMAGKITSEVDEKKKELASEKTKKIAEALKNYGKVTEEVPNVTTDPFNNKPLYEYNKTTREANPQEIMQQDWQLAQLDPSFSKVLEARRTREDTQQARLDQLKLQQEMMAERRRQEAQPYFTPLQTGQGVYAFNARTGQAEPVQAGGKPIVGAQFDPRLQGDIAGAKLSGESTAKRDINMAGLGDTIDRAKEILTAKDGPTQSLIGAGKDIAAGSIGLSTKGAEQADALAAIAGNLVSKMPRMEGPQSNIDVENYRVMAGRIGDRTLPVQRRLAALTEVERLYRKYDKSSSAPQAPAGGVKFLGFE